MSISNLQQRIRSCKTPVALGLRADESALSHALLNQFTELHGEGTCAVIEALRYQGCRVLERAAGLLPAVYLDVMSYLRYGVLGMEVLINLCDNAHNLGYYVIADCRTDTPEGWFDVLPEADAITVMPYVGGDCCAVGEDKAAFAVLRTANASAGEVQNLMSGDRRLYQAVGEQMARRGAGAVVETGYSLDIRELRRRLEKTFMILTNCDGEAASYAFDEYGHGALVVDGTIQSAQDKTAAVTAAIRGMKQWVTVL